MWETLFRPMLSGESWKFFFLLESDVLYCGVFFLDCGGGFCDPCECDVESGFVKLVEVF